MREQHHETAHLAPFRLSRSDELIDNHLRAIREIAELRFPQRQRMGSETLYRIQNPARQTH